LDIVAIIPARFGSTRLPGKPLSDIGGKPMIERVHERARLARLPNRLLVATDDERIAGVVRGFGGEAVLTSSLHASGTDRVAEAAREIRADVVVNVQGDEPLLDPASIDEAAGALRDDAEASMATLAVPFESPEEMLSPSLVKVVVDRGGNALYFSRSPIPHVRLGTSGDPRPAAVEAVRRGLARKHIGIYAYRTRTLLALAAMPPSPLEEAEGLEQLRALQAGIPIKVVDSRVRAGVEVNTAEDLEKVRVLLAGASGG
jgi:3-deoxy-manno-octulosonate cytidylyltransferase (CMP-KDO synthetase)